MNDPRGSLWGKWDLHVHTPYSITQEYGGNTDAAWEKFIKDLENLPAEFKVIGINDYIFIDGYKRVLDAKSNGRLKNIDLILPVIELRLDKFGGTDGDLSKVNFHIIFSNEVEPDIIQEQFLNAIKSGYRLAPEYEEKRKSWSGIVTRSSLEDLGKLIIESAPPERRNQFGTPLKEGFNNINFSYERVIETLRSSYLKNKYITAVGKTEWANIKWNDQSIAEKKTIINGADFVFISAETIEAFNKAKKNLSDSMVNSRLLDCSDAHRFSNASFKDRIGKCFTWIKADTTFEGLKHVLNEPEERIYIGELPDKLKLVNNNRTKYIKSLKIYKKLNSQLNEVWFDNCELFFNHGLISIIGNKGMGKSALTDILALLGNSSCKEFSFLNNKKFRSPKNNKAREFEAQVTWESNESPPARSLANDTQDYEIERVKYIPQKFFESICNENVVEEGSEFDKELKKVIFSHVDEPNRLGCFSIDDLIKYKTTEINNLLASLRSELHEINDKIINLEYTTSNEYREKIKKHLDAKISELDTHDLGKPKEASKPILTSEIEDSMKIFRSKIEELSSQISEVNDQIKTSAKILASITKTKSKIENFRRYYESFKKESISEFEVIGISFDSLFKLEIDTSSLVEHEKENQLNMINLKNLLDDNNEDSLSCKKRDAENKLVALQSKLSESDKAYQSYLTELSLWSEKREKIIGDANIADTIKYYENILKKSDEKLKEDLLKHKEARYDHVNDIYFQILELSGVYVDLYKPVQHFIDSHDLIKNKHQLNFDVSIIENGFIDNFFKYISQGAKGTFHGAQEGREHIRTIIEKCDFNELSEIRLLLDEVMLCLETDQRDMAGSAVKIGTQLKKSVRQIDFYDFLFSLEYLEPKYLLQLGGKDLLRLSPGERGVLLLIFYLLVDKDDCPLIIDQPEDNLDNQSVFELIAPCIREARIRRQVFIVTHNPNLAVVCDAEQVIAGHIDKLNGEKVTYISGSIENPDINNRIITILEGTKPAFKNRESKYFLERYDRNN